MGAVRKESSYLARSGGGVGWTFSRQLKGLKGLKEDWSEPIGLKVSRADDSFGTTFWQRLGQNEASEYVVG